MQAVISTKHGFQLQEFEKPTPGDNDILVKIHTSSVTRGDVVLHNLPGMMYWSPIRKLVGVPPKKTTPGHEFAGVVEATGQNVTKFKVGDSVFGTTTGLTVGSNAEHVLIPQTWESGVIAEKPAGISFEEAAVLPVGSMTALYLLNKANIKSGEKVLIYGASGSVGSYAVQLAKHFGTEVTGVCSTRNIDLVKSLGADKVIDYKKQDFTQHEETYDIIFDAVGKTSPSRSKQVLKQNGRYTSIRTSTHESEDLLGYVKKLVEAGEIRPIIDKRYTLGQINEAYDYVKSGRKVGNIVIKIDNHPLSPNE